MPGEFALWHTEASTQGGADVALQFALSLSDDRSDTVNTLGLVFAALELRERSSLTAVRWTPISERALSVLRLALVRSLFTN